MNSAHYGRKVIGEWCVQPQYMNIGKWPLERLYNVNGAFAQSFDRRAAEKLPIREGASS